MTDTLRDLLHEAVADADLPDLAELAWAEGRRVRRRRATSATAGVAAVALVVGGVVWAADQRDTSRAGEPVHSPSPTAPGTPYQREDRADGEFEGTSVWWAPSVEQESMLPAWGHRNRNPLPPTIDLSAPVWPLDARPGTTAVASFAVSGDGGSPSEVLVLGSDGLTRAVSLAPKNGSPAPVSPMRDPEGNLRIRAGSSMLSPSGRYLMFPQSGSIRLLDLIDKLWSTIDTGAHPTGDATWADGPADRIVLRDPERPSASPPVYDVTGGRSARPGDATDFLVPRWNGDMYGLPRRSPNGSLAQTYTSGLDVPQPPSVHLSPRQSDAIGIASAPDAMLVLPQDSARQKQCCQVAGWLDRHTLVYESRSSEGLRLLAWRVGTGRFWQVSEVVGWTLGADSVVSSYADLFTSEDCCFG